MTDKNIKRYLLHAFFTAVFAVVLMLLYFFACTGSTNWFEGVLLFHTPIWFIFIVAGELLTRLFPKLKLLYFSGISGVMIVGLLIVTMLGPKFNFKAEALYYAMNYVFCVSVFAVVQKKINAIP